MAAFGAAILGHRFDEANRLLDDGARATPTGPTGPSSAAGWPRRAPATTARSASTANGASAR